MTQPSDPIDRRILSCLQTDGRAVTPVLGGFEYNVPTKLGRLTIYVCHENGLISVMVSIILSTISADAWKCVVAKCMAQSDKGEGQFHFNESPFRVACVVSQRIEVSRLCPQIHELFRRGADTLIESVQSCLRQREMTRAAPAARRLPHPDSGLV